MGVGIISHLLLLFTLVCLVVCAAIMWHVYRTDVPDDPALVDDVVDNNNHNIKARRQYVIFAFFYVAIVLVLHHAFVFKDLESDGRSVWRYLFYGLLFFIITGVSPENDNINLNAANQARIKYNEPGTPDFWDKILAALIIGYIGLFLGMMLMHGPFKLRVNFSTLLWVIALILTIIGTIILWSITENGAAFRREALLSVSIPTILTLLVLEGSIFHAHVDAAQAATFFMGMIGLWYLAVGFQLKEYIEVISGNDNDKRKAWAGCIFCWVANFVMILCARFAVANFVRYTSTDRRDIPAVV